MRLVKSLNVVLLLSILLSLCTCANPDISSSKQQKIDQTTVTTIETQAKEPEETKPIEDKFVILGEVYDILSGPLGEPYLTPEYWGGEEINMMRVGDDYLIGLRNVKNQMHYLLYERETNSIIEIDTQGKRIIWEDIYFSSQNSQICFRSYEPDPSVSHQLIANELFYHIQSKEYTYHSYIIKPDLTNFSYPWEVYFDIPSPSSTNHYNDSLNFLMQAYHSLHALPYVDYSAWYEVSENICLLNQPDWILMRLENQSDIYCLYQKVAPAPYVAVLPIGFTRWEISRFQSGTELRFSDPGFTLPNAYVCREFPSTVFYNIQSQYSYEEPVPLTQADHDLHYQLGLAGNTASSQLYRVLPDSCELDYSNSLTFCFEMLDNPNELEVIFPEIYFHSENSKHILIEFWDMKISEEIKQQIESIQKEGLSNFHVEQADLSEENSRSNPTRQKLLLSFDVEDGYTLYGEIKKSSIPGDTGGYLSFWTEEKTNCEYHE